MLGILVFCFGYVVLIEVGVYLVFGVVDIVIIGVVYVVYLFVIEWMFKVEVE